MSGAPPTDPARPEDHPASGTAASARGAVPPPRVLDSRVLLAGQSVLLIRHQGEVYRLQTTRQGKLILTK